MAGVMALTFLLTIRGMPRGKVETVEEARPQTVSIDTGIG
jgi:hypothetical protein